MGNHLVGQEIDRAAQRAVFARKAGESALDILDRICFPHSGSDAEFESTDPNDADRVHPEFDDCRHPHPHAALGMLMLEAFAPNGVSDLPRYAPMLEDCQEADDACAAWWAEVREPFRKRYGFC